MRKSWGRRAWRLLGLVDTRALRFLGISPVATVIRRPVLLLEVRGRRSGRTRFTAVAYWQDPTGRLLVCGGAGGMARVDWIANLRAQHEVAVWIRRRRLPVAAAELTGGEYDRARHEAFARWPDVAHYERRSGRHIPIFGFSTLHPGHLG